MNVKLQLLNQRWLEPCTTCPFYNTGAAAVTPYGKRTPLWNEAHTQNVETEVHLVVVHST